VTDFTQKLKHFLHDPIDKCLDIKTHINRARQYAELLGVNEIEEVKGPDYIASAMERTLLPKEKAYPEFKKEMIYQAFSEIRHPLSESFIEIPEPHNDKIFSEIKEIFKKVGINLPNNGKEKFLYLWRNLSEILSQNLKGDYKKYLSVLPADTRIPDHSIWEHLKITSAINAFENFQNNSLFLFAIGPVQGFISQARKTQDLFMGSFLLSYLTFIAMTEIIDVYGPTNIIYPDLFAQPLMDWYVEKKLHIQAKNSTSRHIDQPTIPNRFVAIIPETRKSQIERLAQKIEENVRKEWEKIVYEVLKSFEIFGDIIGLTNKSKISDEIIKKQTKGFPEIYWVALPFKNDDKDVTIAEFKEFFEDDIIQNWQNLWYFAKHRGEHIPNIGLIYQLSYSALEKSMGARKNLRDFEQTEEYGKKCHICGEKEAVIKERLGSLEVGRYIDGKEGLCLQCFAKRALNKYLEKEDMFGPAFKDFSFPSTAEVASADFKAKVLKNAKDEFKDYIKAYKEMLGEYAFNQVKTKFLPKLQKEFANIENIDGEWFFEENVRAESIKKQFGIEKSEEEIDDKLKKLIEKLYHAGKPNPYYAVILLDGDDMGKWLSGTLLPNIEYAYNSETWKKLPEEFKNELKKLTEDKFLTPAIHASISHALRNYSIEFVREIVEEEHLGKLVYAGGDDVFAFVNLKDLFEVMRKLRAAFSGHIKIENNEVKVDWSNNTGFVEKDGRLLLTMGKNATASCGVVIAHYKMPLKMVIDKAREMEKKAKENFNKDSFAIVLLMRSGEERIAISRWKYEEIDILEKLEELSNDFKEKKDEPWVSDRIIYTIGKEFARLKDDKGRYLKAGIIDTEIKRIVNRATHAKDEEKRKKFAEKMVETLQDIFWKIENMDSFLNLLEISVAVTRGNKGCS
jgi:CRISPR-associated protein Cmr2